MGLYGDYKIDYSYIYDKCVDLNKSKKLEIFKSKYSYFPFCKGKCRNLEGSDENIIKYSFSSGSIGFNTWMKSQDEIFRILDSIPKIVKNFSNVPQDEHIYLMSELGTITYIIFQIIADENKNIFKMINDKQSHYPKINFPSMISAILYKIFQEKENRDVILFYKLWDSKKYSKKIFDALEKLEIQNPKLTSYFSIFHSRRFNKYDIYEFLLTCFIGSCSSKLLAGRNNFKHYPGDIKFLFSS